jgi:oligoendopeptidase F
MTCHTDNAEAEKAYLHFIEHVEPQLKPRQFKLARTYVGHPLRAQLPKPRYQIFDRDTQVQVELFREENVPLETEEAKLGQQYQKLTGSLTVQFRGEERTLVQMGCYLEEPDRPLAPGSVGVDHQPAAARSREVRGNLRPARQAAPASRP